MNRITTTLFVRIALCLGLSLGLYSQSVSQISGTVRDPTGAAVPGAAVTASQTETGLVRTAETDQNGSYLLPSLPILGG